MNAELNKVGVDVVRVLDVQRAHLEERGWGVLIEQAMVQETKVP